MGGNGGGTEFGGEGVAYTVPGGVGGRGGGGGEGGGKGGGEGGEGGDGGGEGGEGGDGGLGGGFGGGGGLSALVKQYLFCMTEYACESWAVVKAVSQ